MNLDQVVRKNQEPERFNRHAQGKVTAATSDDIDAFAARHGLKRSPAIRVLLELGLEYSKILELQSD